MYTQFFGLREKPFAITPDPQYLYLSYRHGEALAHLLYGVTESGGFIQLTGEVGTGKTLLTRTLLDRLPENIDLAVVLNPRLDALEFLETICDELHIQRPEYATIKALVDTLNRYLLDSHVRGRHTVLLVDEAQNLGADVLEQLRLLTNLETSKQKLLQIILVGQPELRQTLARKDLRQLAQRITGRYHLGNLTASETAAYIDHRLKVAGATRPIFKKNAITEVHRATGGVPRLINVICDRALLGAYTGDQQFVTGKLVRDAAAEVGGRQSYPAWNAVTWAPELAIVTAILALGIYAVFLFLQKPSLTATEAPIAQVADTRPSPATPVVAMIETPAPLRQPDVPRPLDSPVTTPAIEVPAEEEPSVISLTEVFAMAGEKTGTDAAMRALFRLWDVNIDSAGGPPCDQVRAHNLKCEYQVGSWTLLEQLDRPAILSLVAPGGETHQVVIGKIDGDRVSIVLGNDVLEVSANRVRELWFGRYLVAWRPNPTATSLLVPGARGDGVRWLRAQLERLQGGEVLASNVYDSSLTERVRRFQRERNLEVDGLAGVHTLIALSNVIDGTDGPRLKARAN